MELTEKEMENVEQQMATIGYMLANYEKFGEDALKVANKYFYELGKSMGQSVKEKMGIKGSGPNAVAAVMSAILEKVGTKPTIKIEGDKVIIENAGFCPVMEAVRIMNAPWELVCRNYSWRWFEGIAAGVNPNVTMEVPESRIWGGNRCYHVMNVPKIE